MATNNYFERTSRKETEDAIPDIVSHKHRGNFTHYLHKFDGTHIDLHFREDEIKFITRDGHDVSHLVPYLVEELKEAWRLKAYYGVYACELVHLDVVKNNPQDAWSASRRVLGCKEYNPNEPRIQCIIYDVYERDAIDLDLKEQSYHNRRFKYLPKCGAYTSNEYVYSILMANNFYVPTLHLIDEGFEASWEYHITACKREGFVLVDCNPTTEKPIKWSHTFTKLKPWLDIDCIVTDYNEGKKGTKLEGKIGSFEVSLIDDKGKLVSIGKVPTMNDEAREFWTRRMESNCIGSELIDGRFENFVIQVKAGGKTVKNKLRFPSYVRERTDKSPMDCTFSQLE